MPIRLAKFSKLGSTSYWQEYGSNGITRYVLINMETPQSL